MIKEYRLKHGFTQSFMADYLGISLRQYQRIDNLEFMPRKDTLLMIFELLDIPFDVQKNYIWYMWCKKPCFYDGKKS